MRSLLTTAACALVCRICCATQQPNLPEGVIAATPDYDLAVTLQPDSHRMHVGGTLRLPSRAEPQETIELDLSDLMKGFQAEITEPAGSAGPVSFTEGEKKNSEDHFVRWLLHPKAPIAAHQPVRIRFSYGGGSQAFVFYLGPEGSFAGGSNTAWYPRWNGNEHGRGRLKFSVPPGYTVLATGKSRAVPADEAQGHFEFENKVPSQFSFAAGKYTVLSRDGIVPMRAYLLHPRSNANEYLDGCSSVLAVLSAEFGKYPYDEFAIAEVPSDQAHQTGFSGASMNGFMLADKEALDEPFNLAYYGHEIGHQWWGNSVTTRGNHGDYMLSEAMAQFGSLHVVETIAGTVAAEEYRRSGYPGYSNTQCGYGYLRSAESGLDHPLSDLPQDVNSHELADSKGFLVWDLLARTVGPKHFSDVLRAITNQYAFQSISWEEFLAATQSKTGENLSWFYSQWFARTGAPNWQIAWKQDADAVNGEITQTAPFYRATLEVETQGTNGERATHTVAVANGRTTFTWPVAFAIRAVVLDPHFYVLHWLPDLRAAAMARAPSQRAASLRDSGKLDEAEALLRKASEDVPQPDDHGARFLAEYGLARIFMERKNWHEAQSHLDAALAAPTRDPDILPWLYYRYALLAQTLNDDAKLHWAVQSAIDADSQIPGGTAVPTLARALLAGKHP